MNVEGIILAAGLSSRMGTNKLVLDINGSTVIERCIYGMYDICSKIIVVGGHRMEDINHILYKYPKVELIHNINYLDGMFSSVKMGLSHIKGEYIFLIPGDYTAVNKQTYKTMLNVDKNIVIPMHNERKGHPLLIRSDLVKELLDDGSCETLRDFIDKKGFEAVTVSDPGILMDIDTPKDYKKILSYF